MLLTQLSSSAKSAAHSTTFLKSLTHFSTLQTPKPKLTTPHPKFSHHRTPISKRSFSASSLPNLFLLKSRSTTDTSAFAALLASLASAGLLVLTLNEAQNDAAPNLNFENLSFAPPLTETKPLTPIKSDLRQPPRFDKIHEEAMALTSIPAESALTMRLMLPVMQTHDKSVLVLPQVRFGAEGTDALAQLITSLGHRHHLKAYVDDKLNTNGEYRFRAENGFGVNPAWSFSKEMGDVINLNFDWKQKNAISELQLTHGGAQIGLSHMQALTSRLSAGVQWQFAPLQMSMLGFCGRYADEHNKLALTLNNTYMGPMLTGSYVRKVWDSHTSPEAEWDDDEFPDEILARKRAQHELNKQMTPPQTLSIGTMMHISPDGKSLVAAGLNHSTVTYRYSASVDTNLSVKMAIENQLTPGVSFGLMGELKHDGSNENKVGISIAIGG